MKGRSFTEYMQRQFKEFYDGVLDADWVMCSVLHGGHWTLVVMSMLDGKMVYLDSLYDGVTAKTAFTRLSKFLERMAADEGSRKFVSEEWQYYVIPASDLPQSTVLIVVFLWQNWPSTLQKESLSTSPKPTSAISVYPSSSICGITNFLKL